MISTGFGIAELLIGLIAAALSLAFPLAIVFLLYKIHTKLKDIEEQLKKN
ncbi:MAG: hypothetical protein JW730_04720 [Anaerolineales bacterium]|nr:hypothetical protein [Anaerolineales bacterium]